MQTIAGVCRCGPDPDIATYSISANVTSHGVFAEPRVLTAPKLLASSTDTLLDGDRLGGSPSGAGIARNRSIAFPNCINGVAEVSAGIRLLNEGDPAIPCEFFP